jgi:hypothetical protein
MKRKPRPEIAERSNEIEHALRCAFCTSEQRDKAQALALLMLGIELLEELGFEREKIRAACDKILDTPLPFDLPDPRAETRGT